MQINKNLCLLISLVFSGFNPATANTVSTVASGFNGSGDLLVDANGDIYNANFGFRLNNADGTTIVKITPEGQVSQFASGFQGASGMVLDDAGNIIQANISGNFISRVSPSGQVTTIASQGFNSPVGVAINSDGQIFVANCGANSISRIDNGVGVTFSSGPLFQCPNGLVADDDDNLYAVNFNNGAVIKIDPQGNPTVLADSGGGNGHIVFGNGKLYFTNHFLSQVFQLTLEGTLEVLAGSGLKGHQDGEALEATFTALNGIGISPDGQTLYVNETQAIGAAFSVNLNPNVLRAIHLATDDNNNDFQINSGLLGSWYNPALDGQGVVFDFAVAEDRFDAVMYWFTYNDEPADPDTELSGFGSQQHRWFTAIGSVETGASTVIMPIYRSSTGVFNQDDIPAVDVVGEVEVEFFNCFEAVLNYQFTEPELKEGMIELQRLTADINCEILAGTSR